jgi:hypothetical protein
MNVAQAIKELRPASAAKVTFDATRVLWNREGFLKAAWRQRCIDADGRPVPWFTYPAIEYLKQLDLTGRDVFEYGAGHSTLFWGQRARSVVAIEHNPQWHAFVREGAGPNCRVVLETDLGRYVDAIRAEGPGPRYDVVVIDGLVDRRTRAKGALLALGALRPGGLVIVDNADSLPATCRLLRAAGLIQVDMSGLGPCNGYAWTTSLFLARDFDVQPLAARQPVDPPGGKGLNWEPHLDRKLQTGEIDAAALIEIAKTDPDRALDDLGR